MCMCMYIIIYNANVEQEKGKIKCIALTERLRAWVVFCNYRMFLMVVINDDCVCVFVCAFAFCLVRKCCFGICLAISCAEQNNLSQFVHALLLIAVVCHCRTFVIYALHFQVSKGDSLE